MDETTNPFRPGAGTSPPALIGRDELVNHFGVTLRRALAGRPGKSLLPIGLRGVGKTVLLNRFTEIAEQEGLEVSFMEAPENVNLASMLVNALRKHLLRFNRQKPTAKVLHTLGVLKAFSYHLPDGTSFQLDIAAAVGYGDSGDLSDDVTDLLVAVGEVMKERRSGFLLAIDELQYLSAEDLGALIRAIHRTTQLDLPVVLVGAGLPQLPGIAGEAKSYAERLFEFPEMGSLSDPDAQAVLEIPAQSAGVEFQPGALRIAMREAHGYPYFLQEWGSQMWNSASSSPITEADACQARPRIIDHLDRNFFLVRFDRLTPKEKEYLWAMARLGPGPHRSGDIAAELKVKVESVAPRRSGLITKGMIYSPGHGETAFTVPLFDEFMKRAMTPGSTRSPNGTCIGRRPSTAGTSSTRASCPPR